MGLERIERPTSAYSTIFKSLEADILPLNYRPLKCNSLWQFAHNSIHLFASFKAFCFE